MKKLFATMLLIAMVVPAIASAEKVLKPVNKSTMMPIGGADATKEAQILRVDPDGSIYVHTDVPPPGAVLYNGVVEITDAGPADRTQMPNLDVSACTFQAFSDNSGSIYVGGTTVTNSAGVNRGLEIPPSMPFNNVTVTNLDVIYVAADHAGDKVAYACN
jgi:hypothetical protein